MIRSTITFDQEHEKRNTKFDQEREELHEQEHQHQEEENKFCIF
jgi:hypothetical protein